VLVLAVLTGCSVDCGWAGTVKTWVDKNENGIWDSDEQPLAGTHCSVSSSKAIEGDESVTNEQGEAKLYTMFPGCPDASLVISVQPQPGYHLTTQMQVSADESDEGPFFFGFAPTEDSP
jgi:hypothetical protein